MLDEDGLEYIFDVFLGFDFVKDVYDELGCVVEMFGVEYGEFMLEDGSKEVIYFENLDDELECLVDWFKKIKLIFGCMNRLWIIKYDIILYSKLLMDDMKFIWFLEF